jgi:hypothetical protein
MLAGTRDVLFGSTAEIVHSDDGAAACQQNVYQLASDKSGSACNKNDTIYRLNGLSHQGEPEPALNMHYKPVTQS